MGGGPQTPVAKLQVSPGPQQLEQPHSVVEPVHNGPQVPLTQTSPQPQGGEHESGTQVLVPALQVEPAGQLPRQSPPQPLGAPQVAPLQSGAQQPPSVRQVSPEAHGQCPPHPLEAPQALPVQSGVQQPASAVMHTSPGWQPPVHRPPQPLDSPHPSPVQSGAQQPPSRRQVSPAAHGQRPPHPLGAPHALPEHSGVQHPASAPVGMQTSPAPQPTLHAPPQPLLSPHVLPWQLGVHWHVP